ncbi:MAG: hypothetical protein QXS21_03005 [Thermoproteota archaeon]|nr:hypothetical protein [Candidatus Brockarchaeota archaeon]MBO3768386.1 hypothetical protein [Candidatus Brockarchaeota archaeon]MBO3802234.1 hypothetical protein [Candidatus Brockarchaeota archaeon]
MKNYKKAFTMLYFLIVATFVSSLFVGIKLGVLLVLLGFFMINVAEAFRKTNIIYDENKRINLKIVHIVAGTTLGLLSLKEEKIGLGIAFTSLIIYLNYLYFLDKVTKEETPYISLFAELGLGQKSTLNVAFGLISITLTYLFFKNPISSISVLAFAIGDGVGGLFGRLYGKIKLPYNKSKTVEGTTLELLTLLVLFFVTTRNPFQSLLVALLLTLFETLPLPINDNLLYSITAGILQQLIL